GSSILLLVVLSLSSRLRRLEVRGEVEIQKPLTSNLKPFPPLHQSSASTSLPAFYAAVPTKLSRGIRNARWRRRIIGKVNLRFFESTSETRPRPPITASRSFRVIPS